MIELKNRINYLLFLISAVAHLFAFLEYHFLINSFNVPTHWHLQFYILLVFSLLLSLLLTQIKRFRLLVLSLRFFSLLIIGYPLGEVLSIEVILLLTIILEAVYYFSQYSGPLISSIFILITLFNQKPATAWGKELSGADIHNLLTMLFISLLILILASVMKKISESSNQKSQDLQRLNYAVEELTRINLDYQNYAKTVEHESIENERKRVSREMHDIIGYTLTNQLMIIQAALSMKKPLPPQLENLLLQAQKQTREGLEDARNALYKLRDFHPQQDIGLKLIYKLSKTFEQVTGVTVNIDFSNSPQSLGREIDAVLYRLIQEGMINAFRHGKATRIDISLFRTDEKIHLNICDNGRSTKIVKEGIGLKGMRERITSVGGEIETNPLPSGFSIIAQIPYKDERGITNETPAC